MKTEPNSELGEKWVPAVLLLVVLLIWAIGGVLYSTLSPSPDQWFLDYTGWMSTTGAVPYHTFADGNWPACHWLHAASTWLFGRTAHSWRVFDYLVMLVSVGFGADLARRIWGAAAGLWLLLLYPALYIVLGFWFAGQRDIIAGHLSFIGLWFYWRGMQERRPSLQIGTGLVIAFISLIKPTSAILGLSLACHAALGAATRRYSRRNAIGQVALAGLFSVAGLALGFGLLTLQGTELTMFKEMAIDSIVQRFGGNEEVTLSRMASEMVDWMTHSWHWIYGLSCLSLAWHLFDGGKEKLADNALFPLACLGGTVAYFVQVSGLGYTLGMLAAPTLPILASGLGALTERWPKLTMPYRALAALALMIVIGGTSKKLRDTYAPSVAYLVGRTSKLEYYSRYGAGDGMTASQAMALAADLERLVPEGEPILVWGRANVLNFLSGHPQPTRFHHNVVLTRRGLPASLIDHWDRWFEEELTEALPLACVVNMRELDSNAERQPRSTQFLRSFLADRYRAERQVGESILYLRNEP